MTREYHQISPASEEFFYWPPEEISQYRNWCETGNRHHKRRLSKVSPETRSNKNKNFG